MVALADSPAVAQTEQLGGHLGHELHAAFERDELAAADAVAEELGRVRARRTCGRGARPRRSRRSSRAGGPTPRPASATTSPSLSDGSGHSTVRRSSLITMSSSVSNVPVCPARARFSDDLALQTFVGLGVGVADHVATPRREPREHAGFRGVGPLVHPLAASRDRAASRCVRGRAGSSPPTSPAA